MERNRASANGEKIGAAVPDRSRSACGAPCASSHDERRAHLLRGAPRREWWWREAGKALLKAFAAPKKRKERGKRQCPSKMRLYATGQARSTARASTTKLGKPSPEGPTSDCSPRSVSPRWRLSLLRDRGCSRGGRRPPGKAAKPNRLIDHGASGSSRKNASMEDSCVNVFVLRTTGRSRLQKDLAFGEARMGDNSDGARGFVRSTGRGAGHSGRLARQPDGRGWLDGRTLEIGHEPLKSAYHGPVVSNL